MLCTVLVCSESALYQWPLDDNTLLTEAVGDKYPMFLRLTHVEDMTQLLPNCTNEPNEIIFFFECNKPILECWMYFKKLSWFHILEYPVF